jgi:hypothetical protein
MCDSRNEHMITQRTHWVAGGVACTCAAVESNSNFPCVSDPVAIGHAHASLVPDGYTGAGMEFALVVSYGLLKCMYGSCTATVACLIDSVTSSAEEFIG